MAKDKHPDAIPVYNRGQRSYHTSEGLLERGGTHHLPKEEADKLLGYEDLIDARKIVEPQDFSKKVAKLTEERDELKAQNEALVAENENLQKELKHHKK